MQKKLHISNKFETDVYTSNCKCNYFSQSPMPSISSTPFPSVREYVELQVDYWNLINKSESTDKGDKSSKKDSNKVSLKSAFKSIHVSRLASGLPAHFSVDNQTVPFTLTVVTREKKQKSEYLSS